MKLRESEIGKLCVFLIQSWVDPDDMMRFSLVVFMEIPSFLGYLGTLYYFGSGN